MHNSDLSNIETLVASVVFHVSCWWQASCVPEHIYADLGFLGNLRLSGLESIGLVSRFSSPMCRPDDNLPVSLTTSVMILDSWVICDWAAGSYWLCRFSCVSCAVLRSILLCYWAHLFSIYIYIYVVRLKAGMTHKHSSLRIKLTNIIFRSHLSLIV